MQTPAFIQSNDQRARVFHTLRISNRSISIVRYIYLELDYIELHIYTTGRNSNTNSHLLLNFPSSLLLLCDLSSLPLPRGVK